MWSGVILVFFRSYVPPIWTGDQYPICQCFVNIFQILLTSSSRSVCFFCPFFGSDLILARTVSVMKNSSLKSGFALCSIRKSGNLCSFLIPEDLVRTYSLHPKRLRKILHFLLSNWDETLIRKRFLGKRLVYARYQEKNLNLQKMNFRPFEEDWCKLGILAWGLGISRCLLFSFLLEWTEKEGISSKTKSNGVPTYLVITRKLLFPRKRLQSQIQLVRAHPS